MAKFAINASAAMLLPSLVQVSESISGSVVPLAMFGVVLLNVLVGLCNFRKFVHMHMVAILGKSRSSANSVT